MPIETDLSVSPYFDESAAGTEKNYYKVLFKPSVPVQVRELNELQSILQNQIEKFGDNILKQGTIVKGCTFSFHNNYSYVKIKDAQVDGAPVNVASYENDIVTSSTGHRAVVINYADGFESASPDTKTLYLKYVNSSHNGNSSVFASGSILTVQDANYGVTNVSIDIRGTGYSNSDPVVFLSAVAVNDISGTLIPGLTMTQPDTGANAYIVSVNSTAFSDRTVLTLKPLDADLADTNKKTKDWTFSLGKPIKASTDPTIIATPIQIYGAGAGAVITTDSTQRVVDISMTNYGAGYYIAPYVTVRSTAGGSGVSLTAKNFKAKVTILSTSGAVGNGYAFTVSDGVIYQKGYFLNVPTQTIVVDKYSSFPNNLSVGFKTAENIIDAYEDTTLLDNANGTRNYTAPGADRLQLNPELYVMASDEARSNLEFFPIVEFSDGVPFKQNQRTAYNVINDEMALRTTESMGDFVTDQFLVACKSTANSLIAANTFTVVVDPGTAYVGGYRVENKGNYQFTLDKGIDTRSQNSVNIQIDYGNYIVIEEMAGSFDFSQVGSIDLYNVEADYLSTAGKYSSGTISAPAGGVKIGTAKIRNIEYVDSGASGVTQGSPGSRYYAYIFNVQMVPGRSFNEVRSIYHNGANFKGIADVVPDSLSTPGTKGNPTGAVIKRARGSDKKSLDKMVFYTGFDSPLAINSISYTYRKFDDNGLYSISNSGIMQITLSGSEYFPYSVMTDNQKRDLVFSPTANLYANLSSGGPGYANIQETSNSITSTNNSFTNSLRAGDYIRLSANNSGGSEIRRVTAISNSTVLKIDTNPSFTNAAATITRAFPKSIPFPILTREGITASVSTDRRTLTVNLGTDLENSGTTNVIAGFNIFVNNASTTVKSANRDLFVKIKPANNTTGFGYSEYGAGVDGYFTSGSNAVANSTTSGFAVDMQLKIVSSGASFDTAVYSITNSTHMVLKNAVNFTGNADIYPAINSNGPWCIGVPDVFRLKAVYMANTSSVNTASPDVTRNFLIDHNHTPNFSDLAYLVKKKDSALVIGPDDFLLVKFDAFTRGNEGYPTTINSYVDSDKDTRAEVDAKKLSQLNNSYINTIEVPEIVAADGTQYDMIGHIDFRPTVVNSAVLSTTSSGASINPPYTVTFSGGDKKFPVPGSDLTFNCTYFLGRVDSVYMDEDGRINTARGPAFASADLNTRDLRNIVAPLPNKNSMLLNYIKIPPYPSLEENASGFLPSLLNKGVINDINLTQRINSKRISRLLTSNDVAIKQPSRYTMADIGNLERRIKDLEYYVSLNLLETSIKDLNLPSSVSPGINRFKYGFFADDFNTERYSDVNGMEYAASIVNSRVVPPTEKFKFFVPKSTATILDDKSIVGQLKATVPKPPLTGPPLTGPPLTGPPLTGPPLTGPPLTGPPLTGPPLTGPPLTGPPATGPKPDVCIEMNFLENGWFRERPYNADGDASVQLNEKVTMASNLGPNPGTVTIYLWAGREGMLFELSQSLTGAKNSYVNKLTAVNSVKMTDADINYLKSKTGSIFSTYPVDLKNRSIVSGNKISGGGKIVFTHNPANGKFYNIKTKGKDTAYFYRIEYPVNGNCGAGGPTGPQTGKFTGVMTILDTNDKIMAKAKGPFYGMTTGSGGLGLDDTKATYYRVHFKVTGLRASTWHKVKFNNKDVTHLVDTSIATSEPPVPPLFAESRSTWDQYSVQIPDAYDDAPFAYVMSDASGKIEAYLYLLKDESVYVTSLGKNPDPGDIFFFFGNYQKVSQSFYDEINNPTIEIKSDDGMSYAFAKTSMKFKLFAGIDIDTSRR